MKKIINYIQIAIGGLTILAIVGTVIYIPVDTYINSHYATARECTVQSAELVKSGSGSKVASSKMVVYVTTSDCGTVSVTKDSTGNQDPQKLEEAINRNAGNKLTFFVGPLGEWGNYVSAEYVVLPE